MQAYVRGVFGMPGSGKSYSMVQWLTKEVFAEPVRVVTNMPLKLDAIERYMSTRGGLQAQVDLISSADWVDTMSGPWDVVDDTEVYTYFIIDEAHDLLPRTGNVEYRKKFAKWMKTLRHEGCEVVLLTQVPDDWCPHNAKLVSEWQEVRSLEDELDPAFGIRLGDWYQLKAAIEGKYSPVIVRETLGIGRDGSPTVRKRVGVELDPAIYQLYDSHSQEREGARSLRKLQPFEQYGRLGVFRWFLFRNFFGLFFGRLVRVVALILILPYAVPFIMGQISGIATSAAGGSSVATPETPGATLAPVSSGDSALAVVASNKPLLVVEKLYSFNGVIRGRACIDGQIVDSLKADYPGWVLRGSVLWVEGVPYAPGTEIPLLSRPGQLGSAAALVNLPAGPRGTADHRLQRLPAL